jgi:hypothetical protein
VFHVCLQWLTKPDHVYISTQIHLFAALIQTHLLLMDRSVSVVFSMLAFILLVLMSCSCVCSVSSDYTFLGSFIKLVIVYKMIQEWESSN